MLLFFVGRVATSFIMDDWLAVLPSLQLQQSYLQLQQAWCFQTEPILNQATYYNDIANFS